MIDLNNRKQFTSHLSTGAKDMLSSFIKTYEDVNGIELTNMREIFEAILDVASSKFEPYKNNSSEIDNLKQEVNEKTEEIASKKEFISNLTEQINEFETKIKELNIEIFNLKESKKDVQNKSLISYENLTKGQLFLLRDYLEHQRTMKRFAAMNSNGKFDGIFDEILETESEQNKILKLLMNTFVLSAIGKVLPQLYTKNTILKTLFDLTENEKTN